MGENPVRSPDVLAQLVVLDFILQHGTAEHHPLLHLPGLPPDHPVSRSCGEIDRAFWRWYRRSPHRRKSHINSDLDFWQYVSSIQRCRSRRYTTCPNKSIGTEATPAYHKENACELKYILLYSTESDKRRQDFSIKFNLRDSYYLQNITKLLQQKRN